MLITQDDIQRIGDEETLLHFLEEKLNLPIPPDLALEDITTKFANFALGLGGVVADQVLDCQELSVSPGESSGIILIRFNSESGYVEVLRAVAEGLGRRGRSPADLRFICTNEHCQPFAVAYFSNSESENWQNAVLDIRAWTQKNTHIHTSSDHEFPANFFSEKPPDEFENDLEGETKIGEFNINELPSDYDVSTKLEDIGKPLGTLESIRSGITTAYDRAFIIDARTCESLLAKDPNSIELIKRSPRINRKWICESKYLIGILSSHIKQWPWSHARSELAAERIFKKEYPAIHTHLSLHIDGLKNRSIQGKFYWEMSNRRLYSMSERSKIIYPLYPTVMQAAYDPLELEGIPTSSFCIIPTTDFSLLAILNSNCFQWYAKTNYLKPIGNQLSNQLALTKKNMQNFPIAPRTEMQKVEISHIVQQILDAPNSSNVPDLEEKINMLVYDLYELTAAEIALIEEESSR